jgi:hypothetical protein
MAAMRMNKKREAVLYARDFLKELDLVFADARRAYLAELKRRSIIQGVDLTKKLRYYRITEKTWRCLSQLIPVCMVI